MSLYSIWIVQKSRVMKSPFSTYGVNLKIMLSEDKSHVNFSYHTYIQKLGGT